MAEQLTLNQPVPGSSPGGLTKDQVFFPRTCATLAALKPLGQQPGQQRPWHRTSSVAALHQAWHDRFQARGGVLQHGPAHVLVALQHAHLGPAHDVHDHTLIDTSGQQVRGAAVAQVVDAGAAGQARAGQ